MPDHFVVLRHQEGDDWDYAVIQHLGPESGSDRRARQPPNAARDLRAWHNDTFVSGPSWAEFTRQMGIGGSANCRRTWCTSWAFIGQWPGHREQLEKALNAPALPSSKIQTGSRLPAARRGRRLDVHDGYPLQLVAGLRNVSARRLAAGDWPRTQAAGRDIRQHSAFHRDTIADRIFPAK